jgi:hypothetical protein
MKYYLGNQIQETMMGRACGLYGGEEKCRRILLGKREGKRPLGRHRHRWKANIKMDLKEVGQEGMDWLHLAQDRDKWQSLVSTVINFIKCGEFLDYLRNCSMELHR